jgi:hypothetical protein
MRSVDLFRGIEGFVLEREANVNRYVERAKEGGFTFGVLQEDGFEECIKGQRKNFADNAVCFLSIDQPTIFLWDNID